MITIIKAAMSSDVKVNPDIGFDEEPIIPTR